MGESTIRQPQVANDDPKFADLHTEFERENPVKNQIENSDLPLGERYLTLCEAAEVLRLSERTVREYVKRGEIRGKKSSENGGDLGVQILTLSLKTHPLGGTLQERIITGIRRCISDKDRRVDGISTSLAPGQGSTAKTCLSSPLGLFEAISMIHEESPIC
jgi:excisionase family DNA binding protein